MGNMFWKEQLETQTPNSMSTIPSHKCCTRILKNEYNFEHQANRRKLFFSQKQKEQLKKYKFDKFYDDNQIILNN